jgi:hypothetical protein
LVIVFPGSTRLSEPCQIEIGDLPAGETSDYRSIPYGVYRMQPMNTS